MNKFRIQWDEATTYSVVIEAKDVADALTQWHESGASRYGAREEFLGVIDGSVETTMIDPTEES